MCLICNFVNYIYTCLDFYIVKFERLISRADTNQSVFLSRIYNTRFFLYWLQVLVVHEASNDSTMDTTDLSIAMTTPNSLKKTAARQRRVRVPDKPNYPLNLWSIMKNCIGKDLSKIPMPVNFNEPLSMLQRLTEDYEYTELLDKAAECTDPCEQLAYVAAFTISSYSTTSNRTGKPFNPLLGETYECDRSDDLGWRYISEQVSHHPPMAAIHCEGKGWVCWQEFTMGSKFRGKYLQVRFNILKSLNYCCVYICVFTLF